MYYAQGALILVLSTPLLAITPAYADNNDAIKTAGDVVMLAIPAMAYASTYYMDDPSGRNEFYKSFATNTAATYGLKALIKEDRPDGSGNDSFPSGHTSVAFQSAAFIQKRYGFEYSVPAYIGATFVGYSRVKSHKHRTSDVLAGAALGVASSLLFTTQYNNQLQIGASLAPDSYQLALSYQF